MQFDLDRYENLASLVRELEESRVAFVLVGGGDGGSGYGISIHAPASEKRRHSRRLIAALREVADALESANPCVISCPTCRFTWPSPSEPSGGDFALCGACTAVLVFDVDAGGEPSLRLATSEEIAEAPDGVTRAMGMLRDRVAKA